MGHPVDHPGRPGKRLTHDERLRAELELCHQWGIPHSQFLGAGTGRWTLRDREKALAYRDYQRTLCPQCGTRYDDWDHGHDDEEDAYAVTVQRCVGCQVIADKQAELQKDGTDPHGLKVGLLPVAVKEAMDKQKAARPRRSYDEDDDE
ncbi:hypothetical protein [Streptomyces sp. NPDC006551]|uniref:hypothetical protein n=1 Tax=Streptomyces sp. NPDC006551 TaxID=3157178 RepID=UPI00339E9C50